MSRPLGIGARLLISQLLTLAALTGTLMLLAAAVGPRVFHRHLRDMAELSPAATAHAEQAFRTASSLSLAVAIAVAVAVALVVSAFAARRLTAPVSQLAAASTAMAEGRYDVRVPPPALGREFAALASAFNTMASAISGTETTRRRLLADLAHELRTPLATLDAYLEGITDGVIEADGETLNLLTAQTARMQRLTEDISALSRAEEHQLELRRVPTDPTDVVAAAVASAQTRYATKGVRLLASATPNLPTINVDVDRIGQVLGNLLDNALRHTPAGGRVTVSADATDSWVRFVVADTGDGIPAEHLVHVFERFHRVDAARDRRHGGSGIGLAIVRALVHAHGGTVRADSPGLGRGAAFAFTVPISRTD